MKGQIMSKLVARRQYNENDFAHYRHTMRCLARLNGVATLYAVFRGASRSGMTRRFSLLGFSPEGEAFHLSVLAEAFAGYKLDRHGNVVVRGQGFDAGHAVVSAIARELRENHGIDMVLRHQWL